MRGGCNARATPARASGLAVQCAATCRAARDAARMAGERVRRAELAHRRRAVTWQRNLRGERSRARKVRHARTAVCGASSAINARRLRGGRVPFAQISQSAIRIRAVPGKRTYALSPLCAPRSFPGIAGGNCGALFHFTSRDDDARVGTLPCPRCLLHLRALHPACAASPSAPHASRARRSAAFGIATRARLCDGACNALRTLLCCPPSCDSRLRRLRRAVAAPGPRCALRRRCSRQARTLTHLHRCHAPCAGERGRRWLLCGTCRSIQHTRRCAVREHCAAALSCSWLSLLSCQVAWARWATFQAISPAPRTFLAHVRALRKPRVPVPDACAGCRRRPVCQRRSLRQWRVPAADAGIRVWRCRRRGAHA